MCVTWFVKNLRASSGKIIPGAKYLVGFSPLKDTASQNQTAGIAIVNLSYSHCHPLAMSVANEQISRCRAPISLEHKLWDTARTSLTEDVIRCQQEIYKLQEEAKTFE
jgi:hypothetical protein